MRQISLNNVVLANLPYTDMPLYIKLYKKHNTDGFEIFTWLAGTDEIISGNSNNEELLYAVLLKDQAPEIIRGEIVDGFDFGEWTEQDKLDYYKTQKLTEIAADRYNVEIAGITVNGAVIDTGRDSQALITGAALAAMRDPSYTLRWKAKDGFITLNSKQVIAVADLVRNHVQSCFNREDECRSLIENATSLSELENIKY